MTVKREVTIRNHAGIHCRPSAAIIDCAKKFPEETFFLQNERGSTNLKSLLELLSMAMQEGEHAMLEVSGPHEGEALNELCNLLEFHFDFAPQN